MAKPGAKREIKQDRAARTRIEILQASIDLFARRGILATTMAELARAIKMTPGALYWHFPTKEDLLLAALEELHRRFIGEFAEVLTAGRKWPAKKQLVTFFERTRTFLRYHPHHGIFFSMLCAEAPNNNERVASAVRDVLSGATGGGATGGGTGGGATGGGMSGDAGTCGDGQRSGGELCDDGNMVDTDTCKNNCSFGAASAYCGDGMMSGAEACDDGNAISEDGCEADCTVTVAATSASTCGDGTRQGSEECDDGNLTAGDNCEPDCTLSTPTVISCPAANTTISDPNSCDVASGDANKLIVGTVLLPGRVLRGGQVLIDGTGNITCVSCDCSAMSTFAGATKLLCGQNVVSPGLINSHDHITFTAAPYYGGWTDAGTFADGGIPERYEHRHDWRVGGSAHAGHFSVPNGGTGGTTAVQWSELRQLMSGTTSVAGSGGTNGLLRNLDKADVSTTAANQQGLGANTLGALYDTFPLKDTSGAELTESCSYPQVPSASIVPSMAAYLPHISEGIERSARNEFLCMSGVLDGGVGVFTPRTAMIHGIALKPADVRLVSSKQASLIWSPRSNVSLYGETAQVSVYARARVNIAIGSDWVRSGSMNILRELQCADYLSSSFYGRYFSAESLWRMPTVNASKALVVSSRTGLLAPGRAADIAIFRAGAATNPYRAVVGARPEDVLLTMRGGAAMYGDEPIAQALVETIVPVQGLTQSMSETITATLGAAVLNTNVRVIGAAEMPVVTSCSPNPLLLPEDGTANLTVTLDLPPATPTNVAIDADAGFTLVPPTTTVLADTRTSTFQVLAAPGAIGPGTILATLGTSMVTCNVTISNLPTTNHVVISEVQITGPAGGGNDEFLELYNPTALEVDLSGWRIQYRAAAGTTYSNAGQLPAGSKISSHAYFLIVSGGAGNYTGTVTGDYVRVSNAGNPTPLGFSGTAGHVRVGLSGLSSALVDPAAIDTVGWGATAIGAEGNAPTPAPGNGQSVERKANQNATAATMGVGGADALFGNALDGDNNGADFVLRTTAQPQNKASGTEP